MKKEIKRRFIDILFEPDETDNTGNEQQVEEVDNQKAKSVLYSEKKENKSAFIDLNEPKKIKKEKRDLPKKEEYEMASQISPIFGVLKENKEVVIKKTTTDENIINKPEGSHLDIITSPIYGYAKKEELEEEVIDNSYEDDDFYKDNEDFIHEDDDYSFTYEDEFEEFSQEELHDLLDDEDNDDDNQQEYSLFDSLKDKE